MDFFVHVTMDEREVSHPRNVARALERLAQHLDEKFCIDDEPEEAEGVVRDVRGSVVGTWRLRSSSAK